METERKTNLKRFGVVVVEDSKSDARLIVEGLQHDGRNLSILLLTDGEKASNHFKDIEEVSFVSRDKLDLILLDLNLPKKSGFELIGEIRSIPVLTNVPVVVFSGAPRADEVWHCYDLGANLVVRKPHEVEPFLNLIKAIEHYCLDVHAGASPA